MKRDKKYNDRQWNRVTDLIDICKELWIKWYRYHPYSSWEKWSIEVHNKYVRRYIKMSRYKRL